MKQWLGTSDLADFDVRMLRDHKCVINVSYINNRCNLSLTNKEGYHFSCDAINFALCCKKAHWWLEAMAFLREMNKHFYKVRQ